MTQADIKRVKPVDTVPADQVLKEVDDELAALSPATAEALEAAFEVIGNELARREVLARRADDESTAERLWAGFQALMLTEGALDEDVLLNDFLRHIEDVREELAEMPPWDPDDDDEWILREGDGSS